MKVLILFLAAMMTGCSPGNAPELMGQTNNMLVKGDIGQELQAPENGKIAVYDVAVKQKLFVTKISSGQSFKVDPVSRQATINGRVVSPIELPGDHELQVVFTRTN